MQSMTWTIGRLGSRFNLLFEPHQRRVMHSALGRLLDEPVDLAVGLVQPDGELRTLPLTRHGRPLAACEQFERFNSITFRGHCPEYRLRFELNVHSVFYPQDDRLCVMPAIYLEVRVSPTGGVRWVEPAGEMPKKVKLFIRLQRPDTSVTASGEDGGRIELAYRNGLEPRLEHHHEAPDRGPAPEPVSVRERIQSLNAGGEPTPEGDGLTLELPVTAEGSGVKWRLVWGAFVGEPVLRVKRRGAVRDARFRYTRYWDSLDAVMSEAIDRRDERLALSRRLEKLVDQAPLDPAQSHLLHQGFHAYLSNTWWCDAEGGEDEGGEGGGRGGGRLPWFSVWEGTCCFHATLDVEFNVSLFYLALWPELLKMQFPQWAESATPHAGSGGGYLAHDLGWGTVADGQAYPHDMPVEENANFLLLMQAYCHWCGDRSPARAHLETIVSLAKYLVWSDRDGSGMPSAGAANTIDDAGPAVQYARKQTYLAVKRIAALRAACDLIRLAGAEAHDDFARSCESLAEHDASLLEQAAWLGDHYAVCVDRSAVGVIDPWTGEPLPYDELPGWDAYSIYTGSALLPAAMINQPPVLEPDRLRQDVAAAMREAAGRYGCGHTSADTENVWVSQNLWRDHLAEYLGLKPMPAQHYWDLQVMSNTGGESRGFIDTYVNNNLGFYPRGVAAIGYLFAGPRLVIDRLAGGGVLITISPNRTTPQRWPLVPLADWQAGKVPVCVVQPDGEVHIEGETDPVIIHGQARHAEGASGQAIGGGTLIG